VEGGTSASSVAIQPDGKILVVTSHTPRTRPSSPPKAHQPCAQVCARARRI